ncbi:MAG: lipopolysaccharide biosynthesis protein [Aromatoleum sp.]|uniref:lipopolysaccharide biosynthesis protein n=1 Tax=Aromatoleum sp. TaxID=2307007 RepID=UPI00289595D6|nr:lipopolysaccharide biosynthesis protein [Aromatoleum sp.]MDT3670684.1 lipopolysaccharide biosynthesis protein [Aromatoleum sp.]
MKNASLSLAMRWLDRLIGLVSVLVLARILSPDDFGVIAIASLVIGFVDIILDLGVNVALIQNDKATREHYDTAWTLRLIQSVLACAILVAGAPLAGDYFNNPGAVPVLQWMSLGLPLSSLENIGVVDFQKKMRFGLDLRFVLTKRLVGFLVTLAAAWMLRSYWALVIGALSGRAFGVLLSYAMHSMRPRLGLQKFQEVFSVSQWMLVRNIGTYLDNNLHKMLVGRWFPSATLGTYSLADEISAMPSTEILAPLNRVLFPAFVQVKENLVELKRVFLLAQAMQTLIGIPAGVGLAVVAHDAVLLLLGEKWLAAVPFVQLLGLANVASAIGTSGGYLMVTLGRTKAFALLSWAKTCAFVLMVLVTGVAANAADIAVMRLCAGLFGLVVTLWMVMRALENLRLAEIAGLVARPLLGSVAMAYVVDLLFGAAGDLPVLAALTLEIGTGVLVYSGTVIALWIVSGRPEGAESWLVRKAGLRRPGLEAN